MFQYPVQQQEKKDLQKPEIILAKLNTAKVSQRWSRTEKEYGSMFGG